MHKMLCVGEIVNTHGVKGELKVIPLLDNSNDLVEFNHFFIDGNSYEVEHVIFHKNFALIKLNDINDMTFAERFKGKFLELPREELKPLPDGRYYICDLIGLKVIDEKLGDLGEIKEVLETVSNDVYVINYKGSELCIPVLDDVVHDVNLEEGIVKVTLPKGLI